MLFKDNKSDASIMEHTMAVIYAIKIVSNAVKDRTTNNGCNTSVLEPRLDTIPTKDTVLICAILHENLSS